MSQTQKARAIRMDQTGGPEVWSGRSPGPPSRHWPELY
jgi:hypothetical protein